MHHLIHPARLAPDVLLAQCQVRRQRRGGPGGQHRNKVSTAVVLEHEPTGVRAEANERRSQRENLDMAVWRLRLKLAVTVRSETLPADASPSDLWRSRVQHDRIVVSATHEDFPSLLAEALDWLTAARFEVKLAADRLGCSASQLIKFLKTEPPALQLVNAERQKLNLGPLR